MKNSGPRPSPRCILRNGSPGDVPPVSVASVCMRVLSLPTGKAVFPAWIRVDLWLPALPTASPWTTALGWWTPRPPPTAWRPTWWTAQQVTASAPRSGSCPPRPLLSPQACTGERPERVGSLGQRGTHSTCLLPGNLLNLCKRFKTWGSRPILCEWLARPLIL